MRLIDADDFENRMYHEVFEKDTDMQKWESGFDCGEGKENRWMI